MQTVVKRQNLELERRDRIFDPKVRTIGVDKQGLDAQVQEKRLIKQLEANRDEFFNEQAVLMDAHAVFLAQQAEHTKSLQAKDLAQYWERFHKKGSTREWDLNDPDGLKKDIPARIGDADPRCGPSAAQQFHGEDLQQLDRKRAQAEQLRAWNDKMLAEKKLAEWLEQEDERKHGELMEELSLRTHNMHEQAQRQRALTAQAHAEFNKALASQKRAERMHERKQETLNNLEEIRNALDSDLLTENPLSTLNVQDPTRFKRYHMKGLTPEQRQAILDTQAAQQEELRQRRQQEAALDSTWADAAAHVNSIYGCVLEQKERERKIGNQNLAQDWNKQAAESRMRRQQTEEQYRNAIGEEFFNKFNTVSR